MLLLLVNNQSFPLAAGLLLTNNGENQAFTILELIQFNIELL